MTIDDCSHILDSMPIGVFVTDRSGNVKTLNKYAISVLKAHDTPVKDLNISYLLENIRPAGTGFKDESFMETRGYKIRKDGRILEITGAPLNAESDQTAGIVYTVKDITEAEKSRELIKNQEMHSAIGELSAFIAHEIRNPLGGIELFASLLKKELKRKKDVHRVNQIIAAARNVEERISSLILSSESCRIPVNHVNIHEILRDIMMFSEQIIDRETAFISARYADIEPVIECNPDIVKQVFLNLIMNALQSMPEGGRLDIRTNYLSESHIIEIHFIDHCIPNSKNPRFNIFSPPSQTHENPFGLGLAIVHNIVNMLKGSMRMEFIEESKTAFVLSFPVIDIEAKNTGACAGPPLGKAASS
jgi:nitrogen-specific signal transduction histidine kinase